jgi:hypothetical protein
MALPLRNTVSKHINRASTLMNSPKNERRRSRRLNQLAG